MTDFAYFLITGLCIGGGYALVALGISSLYNGTGVLNFAQGDFVMLGALYVAVRMATGSHYLLAVLEGIVVVMLISGLVGAAFVKPAMSRRRDIDLIIVGTIGIGYVLANGANNLLGSETYRLRSPLTPTVFELGAYRISVDYIILAAAAFLVFLAFKWVNEHTDIGLQMRALSADPDAARLSGVNIARMTIIGWLGAGVIGAVAGVLFGTVLLVTASMGVPLTISGFAAAMIGGLHNPWGAVLGGVIIGLAETFAAGYLGTAARQSIAPLIIIGVLLLLPNGIIAGRYAKARTV